MQTIGATQKFLYELIISQTRYVGSAHRHLGVSTYCHGFVGRGEGLLPHR